MSRSRVNNSLTPQQRRAPVETTEYDKFVRRAIRAYARRVADGDIEALPLMLALTDELETATRQAVIGLRTFGYSWGEIGSRLNMSRQGVQQRWGGDRS